MDGMRIFAKEAGRPQKDGRSAKPYHTPREHKHALHKTFRSFCIPGIAKTDVEGYGVMVRSNVKTLIEEHK